MITRKIGVVSTLIALAAINTVAAAKPLKIYIMAGQSNMQGKAKVKTIERMSLTEDTKQMYEDMKMKDGFPSAVENTHGVYFTDGDKKKQQDRPLSVNMGPFKPGYGKDIFSGTTLGPDYAFGIYMQQHVQGPMLIVKTAWGGRDLTQQFRPPSASKYAAETDGHGNPTGHYYKVMIECVKKVMEDPAAYYPGYNKADGFEIAGFVWFHGFNDLIKDPSVYPDYTHALTCLIKDVRKDLNAPKLPFVIGVMGIGGPDQNAASKQSLFRKAQEAAAALPEFQGNVVAVRTEQCWDMEYEKIQAKLSEEAMKAILAENPNVKQGKSFHGAVAAKAKSLESTLLTPNELKIIQTGRSNEESHYMGSAYTYSKIGKSMAEAMIKIGK